MALCALAIPNSQVCSLHYVYVNDVCLCNVHYEHHFTAVAVGWFVLGQQSTRGDITGVVE